jgi:adenine-specific DNA-methyltransferase
MLVEQVDLVRIDAGRHLNAQRQAELGQFMTPAATARLMASMFEARGDRIRLLDAGAAVGSLTAAWVAEVADRDRRPREVQLTAFELDPNLAERLSCTLSGCRRVLESSGVGCDVRLQQEDFIEWGAHMVAGGLFAEQTQQFDAAILNPPYRKFSTESRERLLLRQIGVETSNLYTAFLSIALKLLAPGGEIVAITPRSFCNGPYFRPFRTLLTESVRLRRIHVFESRNDAFREDAVLQENIIFHGVKGGPSRSFVEISSSFGPEDEHVSFREVPYEKVVRANDSNLFIHLACDEVQEQVAERMAALPGSLADLGLTVSTGRVVDFRAKDFLRQWPSATTVPLIYPTHFDRGSINWPKKSKKPNALEMLDGVEELLVPNGTYVLVKRFSAKEERRRVVAAVHHPDLVQAEHVGFENHLNYFHEKGRGLSLGLARGLSLFLNSTLVDLFFRQFNGHTQVNATDLRSLRYPSREQLFRLGSVSGDVLPAQEEIDAHIDRELFGQREEDPVKTTKKVKDALAVLRALGLPKGQLNERSALSLLALLDLKPRSRWQDASAPLMGITPIMEFFLEHYGKRYKPNTRETVRRQTVHQFLEAGLVTINPDDPLRPTNSPRSVYQIEPRALKVLRSYGSASWERQLKSYLAAVGSLQSRYSREREMRRVPLTLAKGKTVTLSPGGQNVLIEKIVTEFCERFAPGGRVIYVGDTDEKFAHFDRTCLKRLGVEIEAHGKMPDVVVYDGRKKWLLLIEAVTSHGPVSPKRRGELRRLFEAAKPGLVFVTAFLDRRAMVKHLGEISWESEVWVADAPGHLIHFDGQRFLGPYEE